MVGQTVSHYRILAKLGEGGMGVVYKAEDTTLDRVVAIKLLPPHSLVSADERARFVREAKAAAALSHPNIATVFEIGEHDGEPFIAMEYIDGRTLNEVLKDGPFRLSDAVSVAAQVAEGLKAAHEKNIVHRDIKSSNIILQKDGKAKILDFGLAKTVQSTKLTQLGSTLGTVAYMSPEQVSGEVVDHRTDLWSLGVVLFEMLAGRLPFAGDYDRALFYRIQNEKQEPLTALRTGIPMALEWVVNKLLAKNPDERYQHATDLIIDLKAIDLKSGTASRIIAPPTGTGLGSAGLTPASGTHLLKVSPRNHIRNGAILVCLLAAAAVLAVFLSRNVRPEPDRETRKFEWATQVTSFVLSPDGRKAAYARGSQVWIRRLDRVEPLEIKNDRFVTAIFWSPNSENIAFFTGVTGENHQLFRVSLDGSQALIVKTKAPFYPRYWGRDDSILVTTWNSFGNNTLLKVAATGGELKPIHGGDSLFASIRNNLTHVAELPDGKSLLLSVSAGRGEVYLQTSAGRSTLYSGPPESFIGRPVYSSTGHILYPLSTKGGESLDIWAIPFNLSSLKITGKQFRVVRNADMPSVSDNGMLSYIQAGGTGPNRQLVLLNREGRTLKAISPPQNEIHQPAMSPDGRTIATMSLDEAGTYDLWLHDIAKESRTQLTSDVPNAWRPFWSPDGKEIVYTSEFFDNRSIFVQSITGRAAPRQLIPAKENAMEPSWSADGRYIFFVKADLPPNPQTDIWYVEAGGEKAPKQLFASRFNEGYPCASPDGRFVAFQSDKSGQTEVYVTDFPRAEQMWQVSAHGGTYPQWVGDEIFFAESSNNALMVVKVRQGQKFQAGDPQELFSADAAGIMLQTGFSFYFTPTRDGRNIIAVKRLGESGRPNCVVVENWFEEFREKK